MVNFRTLLSTSQGKKKLPTQAKKTNGGTLWTSTIFHCQQMHVCIETFWFSRHASFPIHQLWLRKYNLENNLTRVSGSSCWKYEPVSSYVPCARYAQPLVVCEAARPDDWRCHSQWGEHVCPWTLSILLRANFHILTQSDKEGAAVKPSKTSKLRRLPKGNREVAEDGELSAVTSAEVTILSCCSSVSWWPSRSLCRCRGPMGMMCFARMPCTRYWLGHVSIQATVLWGLWLAVAVRFICHQF